MGMHHMHGMHFTCMPTWCVRQVCTVCAPEDAPTGGSGGGKKSKSSFASVGAKFVTSLKELMDGLEKAVAHFVRCIKPNPQAAPGKINGVSCIDQCVARGHTRSRSILSSSPEPRLVWLAELDLPWCRLRMSGTLDAVRLIQAGYPTRIPYKDLYSRYRDMMPPNVREQSTPPHGRQSHTRARTRLPTGQCLPCAECAPSRCGSCLQPISAR